MKILKNYTKSIFGMKYRFFTVIYNGKTSQYCYYLNAIWTKNVGDILIFKSKTKSHILNKYTLTLLGGIYTLYLYLLNYPITVILLPFYMYYEGCKNFVRNSAWVDNVRYFNWVNIVIMIALGVFTFFRLIT